MRVNYCTQKHAVRDDHKPRTNYPLISIKFLIA